LVTLWKKWNKIMKQLELLRKMHDEQKKAQAECFMQDLTNNVKELINKLR